MKKGIHREQKGFKPNESGLDLRIIIEESLQWNSPLYLLFVDYNKVFDSFKREYM
jgi:hypothetical protein